MTSKSKLELLMKNFSIRPGTIDYGKDYEFKITSLVSLRCIENTKVQDVWLAANADDCGAFDDIVLFIELKGKYSITYLIQLKHQAEPKNIAMGEFKSKKDFYVKKYHNTIRDISTSKNSTEIVSHIKDNIDNAVFILFTNRATSETNFLISVDKKSETDMKWLFSEFINTNGSMFRFDYQKLGVTVESDIKHLAEENFFLFIKQLHINDVDAEIEKVIERIVRPMRLPKNILIELVKKYTSIITQWSKGELGGHYILTKDLINNILFEVLLTPYMKKIDHNCTGTFENKIWDLIIQDYSTLVIEKDDLVIQFLSNYLDREIQKYSENEKNINLWKRHIDKIKKLIYRNASRSKKIRPCDAYEYLWKNGHLPLVLEISTVREFEDVLHLLNKLACKIKTIILFERLEKLPHFKNYKFVYTFNDLKQEHRMLILENEVKLQDRISIKLTSILSEKLYHLVSLKNVIYVLLDKFNIGNRYDPLPEIFLTRTLQKVWITTSVFDYVPNDIFVIKYSSKRNLREFRKKCMLTLEELDFSRWKDHNYLKKHHIFITDNEEEVRLECVNISVHFLVLHDNINFLEWVKTIGNANNLTMFIKRLGTDTTKVTQVLNDLFNNDKLSIPSLLISNNPGMGKSVLLDYIALNAPINVWVIKINLYDYVDYYKTTEFENCHKESHEHLKHFARKILIKQGCCDILTESVFLYYLKTKKILLLLDGFDEIPVRYHNAVKTMIGAIHKAEYWICVTTRPLLKTGLEELLNTLARSINHFSKNDQITYLTEYFYKTTDGLTPEKQKQTKIFVDKLLDSATQNLKKEDEEFTGIPLQIKLLAEVFTDNFKQFLQTQFFSNENFDLLYLYRKFIQQKIELVCERYGNSFDDIQHNYRIIRSMYALKLLFTKKDLESLNIDEKLKLVTEFLPNTLQLIQKDGIVTVEDEDNVMFVHRTFAEYLAAEWLTENINTRNRETVKILAERIFEPNYTVVRNIFDRILARECPLHTAAINREVKLIREIALKDPTTLIKTDNGNRSLLHLIAAWGIYHPHSVIEAKYEEVATANSDTLMEFYHDLSKDDMIVETLKLIPSSNFIYMTDGIFNYTPLDYAILSGSLRIAETICAKLKRLNNWITIQNFDVEYINYFAFNCTYDLLKAWACKHYVSAKLNNFLPNNTSNLTSLHVGAIFGDQKAVEDAMRINEIDINFKDVTGKTPLHWATIKGHTSIIRTLLSYNNIDVNITDKYDMDALNYAILMSTNNQEDIINELFKKKPDFTILDHSKKTALHHIVEYSQEDSLKLFLSSEYKADFLEVKDKEQRTPLVYAAKLGNTPIVRLLLTAGANIEAHDEFQETALHWAANNGHVDTVELLLSKGANTKAQNYFKRTPLGLAAFQGKRDVVVLFLSRFDVDIDAKEDTSNLTLLHYAAWKGHTEVVDFLLTKGANINETDKHGSTALAYAIRQQHEETIKLLLLKGASVNDKDEEHTSAILYAVDTGNTDIVEMLLLNGADIDDRNHREKTPLIFAAYDGFTDVISLLLEYRANIEARDNRGMTALLWAAKKGQAQAVELLLENEANLQATDKSGKTALIFAALKNHTSVVDLLLRLGLNIEAHDNEQKTALCWAAMRGHAETVDLLLSAGANSEARDAEGLTSLDWAQKNDHTNVTSLFLDENE